MDVLKLRPSDDFLGVLRELKSVPGAPKNIVLYFNRRKNNTGNTNPKRSTSDYDSDEPRRRTLDQRRKCESSIFGEEDNGINKDEVKDAKHMKGSKETKNNLQNNVEEECGEEPANKKLLDEDDSDDLEEDTLTLLVSEVKWCHQRMRERGMPQRIHQLLNDSALLLPCYTPPPRSRDLELRCDRLRARQQNKEYAAMTRNVRLGASPLTVLGGLGGELRDVQRALNQQLVTGVQYAVSCVGVFFALFVGLGLAGQEMAPRLLWGIAGALAVGLAEIYFIIKQDITEEERKRKQEVGGDVKGKRNQSVAEEKGKNKQVMVEKDGNKNKHGMSEDERKKK